MNKKVFISMLVLSISFLIGLYVLKIFFPQEFVMSIENDRLVEIGTFIDNHLWLYYICCGITAFITYWLYCCACSSRLYLKWYECLYIIATIIAIRLISFYDESLSTVISVVSFVFLPALTKGNIKQCALVYTVHGIAQALSLSIRNLPLYLTNINFITSLFMTLEMYFWLLLFYIIYNYKKKENKVMGQMAPPFYGNSKFYEKKKEKALKKIAKLNEVVRVCDEKLNETK